MNCKYGYSKKARINEAISHCKELNQGGPKTPILEIYQTFWARFLERWLSYPRIKINFKQDFIH